MPLKQLKKLSQSEFVSTIELMDQCSIKPTDKQIRMAWAMLCKGATAREAASLPKRKVTRQAAWAAANSVYRSYLIAKNSPKYQGHQGR